MANRLGFADDGALAPSAAARAAVDRPGKISGCPTPIQSGPAQPARITGARRRCASSRRERTPAAPAQARDARNARAGSNSHLTPSGERLDFRRNPHFFPTEHELPHPTPASAPHDSCWPTAVSKLVFRICRVDSLKDQPGCIETPRVRSEAPDGELIFRAPKTCPDLHRLWSYRVKIPLQTRKLLIQADFRPLASFAHPDSVMACVSCPR